IIGSGGAAMGAALAAAAAGAVVTMVERGTLGGTCVNVGCIPSKALMRAADTLHRAQSTPFAGIRVGGQLDDYSALTAQRDDLVAHLRDEKYASVLARQPLIRLVEGEARLTGPDHVAINGRERRFRRCVVATGSHAVLPPIPGLIDVDPLTSTEALALKELPRRLAVIGGRYIALELAQAFARLGARTTIIQRNSRILPDQDVDVTDALTGYLRAEGIDVVTGSVVTAARRTAHDIELDLDGPSGRRTVTVDRVLAATGRRASTVGLGLDVAHVKTDADGQIIVDEQLRTSNPRVFAAGDVIGAPAFVYTAAYEGRLSAMNALGASTSRDYTALPWVIFTDPQLAVVGLTEAEAQRRGIAVDVARVDLDQVPRALVARDTRGFVKLVKERGGDRLLGATIVAPEGGDLIMEPTLAIRFGITVAQLAGTFHPYLTQTEAVKLAAQAFTTDVKQLSCCAS
ncbi:MAG: mercury(II) reductase, partial [Planctomycetes bacterium]|nr:mercury(II) reductase [Planctomycetota bacterium]